MGRNKDNFWNGSGKQILSGAKQGAKAVGLVVVSGLAIGLGLKAMNSGKNY